MSNPTILPEAQPYFALLVDTKRLILAAMTEQLELERQQFGALAKNDVATYARTVPVLQQLGEQRAVLDGLRASLLRMMQTVQPAWARAYMEAVASAEQNAARPRIVTPGVH